MKPDGARSRVQAQLRQLAEVQALSQQPFRHPSSSPSLEKVMRVSFGKRCSGAAAQLCPPGMMRVGFARGPAALRPRPRLHVAAGSFAGTGAAARGQLVATEAGLRQVLSPAICSGTSLDTTRFFHLAISRAATKAHSSTGDFALRSMTYSAAAAASGAVEERSSACAASRMNAISSLDQISWPPSHRRQ
ncbi:unnamed protein product [Prorocentrum cordatum]|uniref:Uncharacterized protein n=1 Tax=Prorocentrum cordatum TaxID=2364126 RepID=A0ABN9U3A5_9DINO|nr:unnamed protein product [Polarella glacialis]